MLTLQIYFVAYNRDKHSIVGRGVMRFFSKICVSLRPVNKTNMNSWNIPKWLELEIRARDKNCVYCGVVFDRTDRRKLATWEHIINDAKIVNKENIALCCCSCNASKGAKDLLDWLSSDYCKRKNINFESVALIVRQAIDEMKSK